MELSFLSQIVSKSGDHPNPLWGQFELLPICNLRCPMCYIHRPEDDGKNFPNILPASFWINIARQAADAGMIVLSLTGGETLLYPELDTFLEAISKMGLIISFNTNGTLIDEEQATRLAKYSLAKINLTLYGGSDKTYEKVTGCKDGFTRICKAIDFLKATGQNVYLNGVITPDNKDDLPIMVEYAESKGLILHESTYLVPRREQCMGYNPDAFRLSPEDAANASRIYSSLIKGEAKYRRSAAFTVYRENHIVNQPEPRPRKKTCRAGKFAFAVDWRGNLMPCVLNPSIQEDLTQATFSDAWKKCVSQIKELPVPKKCTTCSHLDSCPVCPAAVYLETGTHTTPPEYLCRYSEARLALWKEDSHGIKVSVTETWKNPQDLEFRGCEG